MSYQHAGALQTALFSHLAADSALSALIGDALYDAVPSGTLPETYVMMGEEEAKDAADPLGQDARHDFTLSIVSTAQGFLMAKTVAAAIGQALEIAPVSLTEMAERCFDQAALDDIIAENQEHFDYIRDEVGIDLMAGPAPANRNPEPTILADRLLDYLTEITLGQAVRIHRLERDVKKLTESQSGD